MADYKPEDARVTWLMNRRLTGPNTQVFERLNADFVRYNVDVPGSEGATRYVEPRSLQRDVMDGANGGVQGPEPPVEGIEFVDGHAISEVARFD